MINFTNTILSDLSYDVIEFRGALVEMHFTINSLTFFLKSTGVWLVVQVSLAIRGGYVPGKISNSE